MSRKFPSDQAGLMTSSVCITGSRSENSIRSCSFRVGGKARLSEMAQTLRRSDWYIRATSFSLQCAHWRVSEAHKELRAWSPFIFNHILIRKRSVLCWTLPKLHFLNFCVIIVELSYRISYMSYLYNCHIR